MMVSSESEDDVLMISDEVSTFFQQWILNFAFIYHVCHRKELFDSLKSSEGTISLLDRSSCAIKGIEMVSWRIHDGVGGDWGRFDSYPISEEILPH